MSTYRKTILLSDKNNTKKPSMTLEIENKNNIIIGTVKAYDSMKDKTLLLGIKVDNEITKQNIKLENNKCQFKLPSSFDLNKEIHCTMVDISNNEFEPILWGSTCNKQDYNNILGKLRNTVTKAQSVQKEYKSEKQINNSNNVTELASQELCLEKINSNSSNLTTPQATADIVSQISMEPEQINLFSDIAIASSTAKEELFKTSEEEVNKLIDDNINSEHNFYNLIADQLEELFIRYPREKNLEQLIDNSIWCKIDTDIDNKHYVVGIIKVKNDIKYICYGVPGNYNVEPPIEMRGYSQWLPVDTTNPYENGYWVMYQDSDTGENIFLN